MLAKVKSALRISTNTFDQDLIDMMAAAVDDLEITGSVLPVTVGTADVECDDALIRQAIITYCRCNFGQPDDYDRMKAAYDEQKAQIRENPNYQEDS